MKYTRLLEKRFANDPTIKAEVATRKAKIAAQFDPQMENLYEYVRSRYIKLGPDAQKVYIQKYKSLAEKDVQVERVMDRLLKEFSIE